MQDPNVKAPSNQPPLSARGPLPALQTGDTEKHGSGGREAKIP